MKVKTLKDCKIDNDDKCYIGQIKQDAINTIKSMDMSSVEVIETWKHILPKGLDILPSLISIKAFLIHWANLTKEDLK